MAAPALKPVLILGGTAEAVALAQALDARPDIRTISSLAGRTRDPVRPPGEIRVGGFDGIDGLALWLRDQHIEAVIDATHPFARQISANARAACAQTSVPLIAIARPAWTRQAGDRWLEARDEAEAAGLLPARATALLAVGRQKLAAFADCRDAKLVVRMVDPPDESLPLECIVIVGRPSASVAQERALLEEHGISHLVCRNSGGEAGYAKIAAARELGLDVIMIGRSDATGDAGVASVSEALAQLDHSLYPEAWND